MSKQGLGRGLGTLMGPPPKEDSAQAPVSLGVRTLMGETKSQQESPTLELEAVPAPQAVPVFKAPPLRPASTEPKTAIPRWYLFAGDVVLVSMAIVTLCLSPHPLSWQREVFCSALVGLAAILGVVAILPASGKE